ncbi:carbamoyltransferase HypF [Calderihabitans maritimus]|uniref:Carbamoyltransferase n=1 Tax=Calderihabitans maritimus TaxID=1246530 RepID=A0A1Z5HNU3_9FIRM|nr:carbamoyltransferase HypF [Calderihabitans maritimus]GAW91118.1 (NiFe) hydrogenase maturation protein HypF [Calderihabitans maritimus]
MSKRAALRVSGIVQGVGFRPFVYNLAVKLELNGWVKNTARGVFIEIEGEPEKINEFIFCLQNGGPPLARVEKIDISYLPPAGYETFEIQESSGGETSTLVSPDVGTCDDCRAELFDPSDRRYRYPFINCTNCGPRFTIVEKIPYDRKNTTMKEFTLCPECAAEYHDPSNRRFHAQPNACPVCGPKVYLKNARGELIEVKDVWQRVKEELKNGKIVAVKGLGGYHLCCDALNNEAVSALRSRKARWEKPFAVMMRNIETVRRFCELEPVECELLESPRRPIVLLKKRNDVVLPEEIAPRNRRLGVMLPYTPLHYLLMEEFQVLVMTSGNISDEPIAYRDEDALERLKGIADLFLMHDRKIYRRCDDSVALVNQGKEVLIRRSRGYAPEPIKLHLHVPHILACGAEQKNTFCLTKGDNAFISHHIGDLKNLPTLVSFEEGINHFKELFDISPEIVAYDLHPEYLSTKYAHDYPGNVTKIGVQHHHAHVASCLADNRENGPVIGVSFDGTGYGTDGCLWGGEFLLCDYENFQRVAHFAYVPMPSGSKAIEEPWRMAASYLFATYGSEMDKLDISFVRALPGVWPALKQAILQNINAPLTSSCGRLFDAVAALIGIRNTVTYEGQAAVELEQAITPGETVTYPFEIRSGSQWQIDWKPLFRSLVEDIKEGTETGRMAARFHNTVARIILETCLSIRKEYHVDKVALTGGVFQNIYLLNLAVQLLTEHGFRVLTHSRVPPNDGGLSLGQALIAYHKVLKTGKENGPCV